MLVILLAATIIRVVFLQGFVESDPYNYAELANDLAHGKLLFNDYNGALIFPLRIGLYGPVALLIKIFGLSEGTLAIFPFLTSIAGCLLAYILARNLFGQTAGLIAAGLLAILPREHRNRVDLVSGSGRGALGKPRHRTFDPGSG